MTEPLWSDERIYEYTDEPESFVVLKQERLIDVVYRSHAEALAIEIRDEYEAELAKAKSRIAELEAQVDTSPQATEGA